MSCRAWSSLAVALAACTSGTSRPQTPLPTNRVEEAAVKTAVYAAEQAWRNSFPVDYERPFVEPEYLPLEAHSRYLEACKAGDRRSCWIALEVGAPSDAVSARALVAANCRDGDQLSCRALPADDESTPGQVGLAGALGRMPACDAINESSTCDLVGLRRECDEGFPTSCRRLVMSNPTPQDGVALTSRSVRLADAGCRAGIVLECDILLIFHTKGEREHALAKVCELGRRFCGAIAIELLNAGESTKSVAMLEHACQYGISATEDCLKLGIAYLRKTYVEPVGGRGQQLIDWACARIEKIEGAKLLSNEPDCKLASHH